MSLMNRMKKAGYIKQANVLNQSKVFDRKNYIHTPIPMLNVALSGDTDLGFHEAGVNIFAGPSKHFKTMFCLVCAKAYMDKYPESIMLFYDSEFGSPPEYFKSLEIDTNRVLHIPITDIEDLKFDMSQKLKELTVDDKVIIVVDSLGNLASKKEVEDAMDAKSVADMTRAKAINSFFRIVTSQLNLKEIPMFVISHTYQTQELYSKSIVSGGTKQTYSANNIYIIGRQQEKTGKDIDGYNFIINVEKSRFVKEKSQIPISVRYNGGINKYSGLLEIAIKGKYVVNPSTGWYQPNDPEKDQVLDEKKYRRAEIETDSKFWNTLFTKTNFKDFIRSEYQLSTTTLIMKEEEEYDESISSTEAE